MKLPHILLILVLSCLTAFATTYYMGTHRNEASAPQTEAAKETAFDRITRTNTLRCGYAIAPPWTMVDPNTKQISGVNYDVTNAIAAKLGVKVEWAEETGWGIAEQGLISGRYDMMCGNVCIDPHRARAATFSTPFFHLPIMAIVRADDTRFDNSPEPLKLFNDKGIKIGVKNGHIFEFIANEQFPLAAKVYANDISDDTEFMEMLKTHKIDMSFAGQETVDRYNEKNPDNKIKSIAPARFCNGAFMVPLGDERLKNLIDNAIVEVNSSGQIRSILNHWVKPDDARYARAPAQPYGDK